MSIPLCNETNLDIEQYHWNDSWYGKPILTQQHLYEKDEEPITNYY